MNKNVSNLNKASTTDSTHLTDSVSVSLSEFNSDEFMDAKYEGSGFTDVDFKPGADFEVDETLFQGVNMKEDYLDLGMSYVDHTYCNADLEASDMMLDTVNEEDVQEYVAFQDVGDSSITSENSPMSKRGAKHGDEKDEGHSEEKKKASVVKTYNMRSKRLDVGKLEMAGNYQNIEYSNEDKKLRQNSKQRKDESGRSMKEEESSDDEENDVEESDSDDEEVKSQNKKKRAPPRKKSKGNAKGKEKGKGKAASAVKKTVKGKQVTKKTAKADSNNEDNDEEEQEIQLTNNTQLLKKSNAKGKVATGTLKAKRGKKQEVETSEESGDEDDMDESDSEEEEEEVEEIQTKSGRGGMKRAGKGKDNQPANKKRKMTRNVSKKTAVESESVDSSSDDLPLQAVMNKKKLEVGGGNNQKKSSKEDFEETEEENEEMDEEQINADRNAIEHVTKKTTAVNRDPILSAFTKIPSSVTVTDDSASMCSTDDGSIQGIRSSTRIKKPNRLYITDGSSSLTSGKVMQKGSEKKEKITKMNCDQDFKVESLSTNLNVSETTDPDALIIDESPFKNQSTLELSGPEKQAECGVAKETEELEEVQEDKREGDLADDENQQDKSSITLDCVKRSARIKMLEEVTQEKFKALRAERERTEAKYESHKKKNQDKPETEAEQDEKPKHTAIKTNKEAVKQPPVSAVKNPCRGPSCMKPSLPGSVYCSDLCIQNHTQESIALIEQERQKSRPQRLRIEGTSASSTSKSEERVVVFERKTGKLLTGPVAPTESTLLVWLKRHPTFEVLQPSQPSSGPSFTIKKEKGAEKRMPVKEARASVVKEPAKTVNTLPKSQQRDADHILTDGGTVKEEKPATSHYSQESSVEHNKPIATHRELVKMAQQSSSGGSYSRGGPDPARISIRNTLRETLFTRANETDDVMLSGPEIKRLALDIEQELFGYYGEVNTKYKHKYRTLITHLKDSTNKGLFRKVLFGDIKPNRLVRLSSDSLGSKDLARWKEPEVKTAQENVFDAKSTKKIDFTPKSPFYDPSHDYLSTIIIDTTSHHGNHFFDINCKICTGKIPEPLVFDSIKTTVVPSTVPKDDGNTFVRSDVDQVVSKKDEEIFLPSTVEFSRDPRRFKMSAAGSVASSAVPAAMKTEEKVTNSPTIMSPVSVQAYSTEGSVGYQMGPVEPLVLWKGSVYAHEVAKVSVCAYLVSGSLPILKEDLSDLIVISGRLPPDNVYYYLSQIKQSGTFNRDVAVIRFESAGVEDDSLYSQLFSYLNSRDRCGVISGTTGPTVKDLYIMPATSRNSISSVLLPFDGPGLLDSQRNMLLGIIVKHASKRLPMTPSKSSLSKTWMYSERSEAKEEITTETKRLGVRHGSRTTDNSTTFSSEQISELVEGYTPSLPKLQSRTLGSASKLPDSGNADSSGTSDAEDPTDLSEVARKDPIVSKYSKFDRSSKTSNKKKAVDEFDDENKPYDPFEDDYDKPYDPCSPEFDVTATATPALTAKYNPSAVTTATVATLTAQSMTSSTAAHNLDINQLLKPISGLSSASDVTTAMLTTLAAISTTSSIEEQRRLLSELTEKIHEQKVYLDKQKEEMKNKELLSSLVSSGLTSAGLACVGLGLNSGGLLIGSTHPGTPNLSISGNTSDLSDISGSAKLLGEQGSSVSRNPASYLTSGGSAETMISTNLSQESSSTKSSQATTLTLSQMPFDSGLVNLARKRLAQKAGELLTAPKQDPIVPTSVISAEYSSLSSAPSINVQNNDIETVVVEENRDTQQQTFTCNLSVLPPSVQQLLSGPSFENLKNIVANVTGKKINSGVQPLSELNKVGDHAAQSHHQMMQDSEAAFLHCKLQDVSGKAKDIKNDDKSNLVADGKSNGENLFAANMHGDIDYRVQSSGALLMSKTFEDIQRMPLSNIPLLFDYTSSSNLSHSEGKARLNDSGNIKLQTSGFQSTMLLSTGSSHVLQSSSERPRAPAPFKPSMQALLETPSDPNSNMPEEVKQPLLKIPASDSQPFQQTQEAHPRPQFIGASRHATYPSFPSDVLRPCFQSEADSLTEGQKSFFKSDPPFRAPLLPDIPQPPYPPQMSFQSGLLRPMRPPEMPRPPLTSEMLGSGSFQTEPVRFAGPGLLPLPDKQVTGNSSIKAQEDLCFSSDRRFAKQTMQKVNTTKLDSELRTVEVSKSFAVGDFLKFDCSSSHQDSMTKPISEISNVSSTSLSDDTYRKKKVLLPTPSGNTQKCSQEVKSKACDEGKITTNEQKHGQKPYASDQAAVKQRSSESDFEKKSGKAVPPDCAALIVIDDNPQDKGELDLIPLPPPTSKTDDQAKSSSSNDCTNKEKSTDNHKSERRSSQERQRRSRPVSTDHSITGSRRGSRDASDLRARRSDHSRRSRSRSSRRRRSRSKDRHGVEQTSQRERHRSRSKERQFGGSQRRSRERRAGADQPRRPLRDQRHTSPQSESRRRDEDRNKNRQTRNPTSDQSSYDNEAVNLDISNIPSLMDMIEPSEGQSSKVAIPSLLDIMGVSRELSSRADQEQKQEGHPSTSAGSVNVKYRRDYRHGADSEERGRNRLTRADFADNQASMCAASESGKHQDIESRIRNKMSKESGDFARSPSIQPFYGDFCRQQSFTVERRVDAEQNQMTSIETDANVTAGRTYGNTSVGFDRQFGESATVQKRPLIDRLPKGDFHYESRAQADMLQKARGNSENDQISEVVYRSITGERFGVVSADREEGRRRVDHFQDKGQLPNENPRIRSFTAQVQHEQNPERQIYRSAGSLGEGGASLHLPSSDVDDSTGRFSSPSVLKKSLLGDYPGSAMELAEEVSGQFESQTRSSDLNQERSISPVELSVSLSRSSLKPDPYQTVESSQTLSGWASGGTVSGQRMPLQRFPVNMQLPRPGYSSGPPHRPSRSPFGERPGFPRLPMSRMRIPLQHGITSEQHQLSSSSVGALERNWHHSVPRDRLQENRTRSCIPSDPEETTEMDSVSEKKTLLPMPPNSVPRPGEVPIRMGPRPTVVQMEGQMYMTRPGMMMRMPPRYAGPPRPFGFPEGLRQAGGQWPSSQENQRPRGPSFSGEPRPRGPSA